MKPTAACERFGDPGGSRNGLRQLT